MKDKGGYIDVDKVLEIRKPLSIEETFERMSQGVELKPMKSMCHDCAIKTGFYTEFADLLKQQSIAVQNEVKKRWFCHNNCNRSCAGIAEYLTPSSTTNH